MLNPGSNVEAKRAAFRERLDSGRLQRFVGAFSPLVAILIEDIGFDGVYVSGAALSADLGLPDIGLTTLTEVAGRSQQIASATALPVLVDADTGFGEPANVARTVRMLEAQGIVGCHIEDQVNPKRCGHLDAKEIVPVAEMCRRVAAAVRARQDPSFTVCARTDARAIDGLDAAISRARAYVDAGATMIFPEALHDERDFETFRSAIDVPLLANMTEFGRTELLDVATLQSLGVNVVIYPVTSLRIAMGAVERGLRQLFEQGTQAPLVPDMQTRERLYELIGYDGYAEFDESIANFRVPQ